MEVKDRICYCRSAQVIGYGLSKSLVGVGLAEEVADVFVIGERVFVDHRFGLN